MTFETNSILVTALAVFVVAIVPVKLVASFFDAKNDTYLSAFLALLVSIVALFIGIEFSGLGYLGAYIGMSIAVWLIMRPSFFGSLLVPAVAVIIMFGVVLALIHFNLLGFSS